MKDVLVFYAGLLYGEYSHEEYELEWAAVTPEVYNGGWLYMKNRCVIGRFGPAPGWYRMDGTPCLDAGVPSELKVTLLLLN